MQRLGQSSRNFDTYLDGLAQTHQRRVTLRILTLSHRVVREFRPQILEGQVDVDTTAERGEPSRKVSITFLDPGRTVRFEADGVDDYPSHYNRMAQIEYSVKLPTLGWVDCDVFTGPMSAVSREDAVVTIEARGKEYLAMKDAWKSRTFAAKTRKTWIIRQLLLDAGETHEHLDIPDLAATTPARLTIAATDKPWLKASALASSLGYQLYYDGRGVAVMRKSPTSPVAVLDGAWPQGPIVLGRDNIDPPNTWMVTGGTIAGGKRKATSGPVAIPANHPLSAETRGRNGVPYRVVVRETNDALKFDYDCTIRAQELRNAAMEREATLSVDILPLPALDELDLVRVTTRDDTCSIRLQQFSIPLADGAMALGLTKRLGGRFYQRKKTFAVGRSGWMNQPGGGATVTAGRAAWRRLRSTNKGPGVSGRMGRS